MRLLTILPLLAISGCASIAVSNDSLEDRTAFALGLDKSKIEISNRVDDGVKTNYFAKTSTGKRYSCYVTGTISITGKNVSDAICNETGGKLSGSNLNPPAQVKPATPACNALLRAANRC